MDERERRALTIFREALDADEALLEAFLSDRCGTDVVLRERVRTLLRRVERVRAELGADTPPVATAADDRLIGCSLGPFLIVARIGRGGMGVVYRGERRGDDFRRS